MVTKEPVLVGKHLWTNLGPPLVKRANKFGLRRAQLPRLRRNMAEAVTKPKDGQRPCYARLPVPCNYPKRRATTELIMCRKVLQSVKKLRCLARIQFLRKFLVRRLDNRELTIWLDGESYLLHVGLTVLT